MNLFDMNIYDNFNESNIVSHQTIYEGLLWNKVFNIDAQKPPDKPIEDADGKVVSNNDDRFDDSLLVDDKQNYNTLVASEVWRFNPESGQLDH